MIRASVIIPTRNRADVLAVCLESLCRQTLPASAFEVIVVDNGSTDHTVQVAAGYSSLLNIRCVEAVVPGLHLGRHAGRRAARAGILLFADDDIKASATWVEAVARAFEDQNVGLVGGNNFPDFEAEPPAWLTRWWETPVPGGKALGHLSILDLGNTDGPIDPSHVWGCNFGIRASALDQAGGFHPDGLPREKALMRGDGESHVARAVARAGWAARFAAGASVWHRVPASRMTQDYFERRGYEQGISDSYTRIRKAGRVPPHAQLRAASWVRHQVRCLRQGRAHDPGPVEGVLARIKRAVSHSWRAGFLAHSSACRSDPALLAWVLKDSYMDER